MKKIYLGISMLLATTYVSAQYQESLKRSYNYVGDNKTVNALPSYEKSTILWQDDMSDNTAWTADVESINSTVTWVWSNSATYTASITAGTGFSGLASATVSNGHWIVDSDGNNSGDNDGSEIIATLTSSTIDLTGEPFIKLQFQHNYRWWKDTRKVRVSVDDGATWQDVFTFTTNTTYTGGQSSGNPEVTTLDISSIAGGESQVKVQFYYQDHDVWAWYWAVDDVKIIRAEDYELEAQSVYWGIDGSWGPRLSYSVIPLGQAESSEMKFAGIVKNGGINSITDATYTASIASASYTSNSGQHTLLAGETDTLDVVAGFTPSAIGSYSVTSIVETAEAETNVANNTYANINFQVSSNIYARDNSIRQNGSWNQGEAFKVGPIFDIFENVNIEAVSIHIHPNTPVGTEVYALLYYPTGSLPGTYMDETDRYYVEAGDLDNFITLPLLNGSNALTAGEPYLVLASYDGGVTDGLVVSTSGQAEGGDRQSVYYYAGDEDEWYYTLNIPMVRMVFEAPVVSINNASKLEGVAIYPNPSTGIINISNDTNVENTIVVTDLTGKVVSSKVSSVATTIDLSTAGTGIYIVEVLNENGKKVERIVIK